MKSTILILVLILISYCTMIEKNEASYTPTQEIKEKLQKKEYVDNYLHLLYDDFKTQVNSTIWTDEPPGKLAGVSFNFGGQTFIEIDLKEIPDSIRFNMNRNWTIEKVKTSKIESITLFHGDSIVQEYH